MRNFLLDYHQVQTGTSSNYSSTLCSINFSSLLILVPISAFLLISSALWHTVQILVDKYIFLQQFQGCWQKAVEENSLFQTFLQTPHNGKKGSFEKWHSISSKLLQICIQKKNGKQSSNSATILSVRFVTTLFHSEQDLQQYANNIHHFN